MLRDSVEEVTEEEAAALQKLQEELAESEESRSEVKLARWLSEFIEDKLESEVVFLDEIGEPGNGFETILVRFDIYNKHHPGSLEDIFEKFFKQAGSKLVELIEEVSPKVVMERPYYDQNDVIEGILHTVQVNKFVPVHVSQQHFADEGKTTITVTVLLGIA